MTLPAALRFDLVVVSMLAPVACQRGVTGPGATLGPSAEPRMDGRPTAGRSPWAAARERGVGFRAVGQEPGWVAEVDTGERPPMRVSLDYGQRQLSVDQAHRFDEPQTRTTGYRGTARGTTLELRIRREACRDSMSGEAFDSRVELVVGGETYRGCGRFLGAEGGPGTTR
jgi:uncharacterized membrane protein